jgi:hypothetical protein
MSNQLFSLQGKVYTALRDGTTGKPGKLTWLGNTEKAEVALTPNISDKYESFSGQRLLYGRLMKERKGELNMSITEFHWENLVLALYGSKASIAGGTVTAEAFPTGLVAGDAVQLANTAVSALVITDSTGSPITLVAGTDYSLTGSVVTMLTAIGVQPYHAAYTYATVEAIEMMSQVTPPERYVIFDGVNTFTGDAVHVDLFRVQFTPAKVFGLIDADWGGFDLTGAILYDTINANIANMGGFGRIVTNEVAV